MLLPTTEAVVVRGIYTLQTISYRDEFDRRGSPELHDLMSVLAEEVHVHVGTSATACIDLYG